MTERKEFTAGDLVTLMNGSAISIDENVEEIALNQHGQEWLNEHAR